MKATTAKATTVMQQYSTIGWALTLKVKTKTCQLIPRIA
jgi:hypothetical protein